MKKTEDMKYLELMGKEVAIHVYDTDFPDEVFGKVIRFFNEDSFQIPEFTRKRYPMILLIKLDAPISIEVDLRIGGYKLFHYIILFSHYEEEIIDLLSHNTDDIQAGFHVYLAKEEELLKRGISLERDAIKISDTYGISKEVNVRLIN